MSTPKPDHADGAGTPRPESGPGGGDGINVAGEARVNAGPGLCEASSGAVPSREGMGLLGGRSWPDVRALLGRLRALGQSGGTPDALIWSVLIAVLALYGWYAAGLRQEVEESPVADESRVDAALQRVAAEKAALGRQIAEASARIAALEEALKAQRPQSDQVEQVPPAAPAAPRRLSSLAAELGGRETERGILLDLTDSDLSFPIGKANLPDREIPVLDRLASLLAQHQTLTARVEGHTDSAGRDEVNLALSQERADAVKQALVGRGASAQRIEAVGYGESRPIADNGTRAGRDRNRRIEVYLIEGAN